MPAGNYVVTNWQGHGTDFGNSGIQLLEYDAAGVLVWCGGSRTPRSNPRCRA
jgi:hypothetical protein